MNAWETLDRNHYLCLRVCLPRLFHSIIEQVSHLSGCSSLQLCRPLSLLGTPTWFHPSRRPRCLPSTSRPGMEFTSVVVFYLDGVFIRVWSSSAIFPQSQRCFYFEQYGSCQRSCAQGSSVSTWFVKLVLCPVGFLILLRPSSICSSPSRPLPSVDRWFLYLARGDFFRIVASSFASIVASSLALPIFDLIIILSSQS